MSNLTNDNLLERASVMAEEWAGTARGDELTALIQTHDLDALWLAVRDAEDVYFMVEELSGDCD